MQEINLLAFFIGVATTYFIINAINLLQNKSRTRLQTVLGWILVLWTLLNLKDIFAIIKQLKGTGMTVLLIEQNANAALHACDYAYVMETGKITLSGTGEELLASEAIQEAYLGKSNKKIM